MADLYSLLPGIQVSDNELLEAELLAIQILQAKYPDIDLREGTGLRDLVIRPSATLLAMINKAVVFYFVQNTIDGANDSTPQEMVDKIMSNWFLLRKQGSKAIINARLFFARQKDVTLTTDVFFSTDSVLKYFPQANISIPNGQLTFDAFSNEYYYDIDLIAEQEGLDYNISSGSLLYFSNFDPFFLRAEINFLKATATTTETNSEFITRAKTAVSTRNLINQPSIISKLLEDFTLLEGVSPIGFGDPEMLRDQVTAYVPALTPPTVQIHVGGAVDDYCRVPLTSGIVQITTDAQGKAQLGGAIYELTRSQISGSAVADTIPFYITKAVTSINRSSTTATVITTTPHGFSNGDVITIIGASPSGYNGAFTIAGAAGSTFTYTVPNTLSTPATGTITANKPVPYTVTNNYASTRVLTSLTSVTTTATATFNNHGLSAGKWVLIGGATPAGYNGWFKIGIVTQNTFTYTLSGSLSSPATGTISFTATDPASDYGFSDKQLQIVDFTSGFMSSTASFNIKYFQDMDGLQEYLDDPARRVICANHLARGYNLYLLSVTITAYNGPSPDSTVCTKIVQDYLTSLAPGEIFVLADLTAKLNAGGITSIQTPITVTYRYFDRDLIPYQTGTITDFLHTGDRTSIFGLENLTTQNATV